MRLLSFGLAALAALAVASGCGLDSNGLSESAGEGDGGQETNEPDGTSSQQVDGTVNSSDGSSNVDSTIPGDDGGQGDTSTPEDANPTGDAQGDAGPTDAGSDGATEDASDGASPDSGSDAGFDAGFDASFDAGVDSGEPCSADPGFQCTNQPIPPGWTVIAYDPASGTASCPSAYPTTVGVYEGPYPPASCSCTCSVGTSGSCTTGNFSIQYGDGKCNLPGGSYPAGTCDAVPGITGFDITGTTMESAPAVPYTPGTCSASASTNASEISKSGTACSGASPSDGTCPGGGACVPSVSGGFDLCIEHGGPQPCPAGFTNMHSVGSGFTDTRSCTTCACTGPTAQCNDAMLTVWTTNGCADAGVATMMVNGTCNGFQFSGGATSATIRSFEYTASVGDEQCGGSGSSVPDGGVTLSGPATICCQ